MCCWSKAASCCWWLLSGADKVVDGMEAGSQELGM